ncbi:MAG: ABC transporter substrate-binding protein [Thermomicrobiales bacterium]
MHRRFVSLAMALALMATAMGGLMSARAQETTEITYFTFSAGSDQVDTLEAMIALFEEANPGITVNVEVAPFNDYFTELQTRIAGGNAPDVFELNYENFVTYASREVLLDLTERAAADPEFTARFYPKAYEAFNLDGARYGLPGSFSNVILYYNQDLFDAAGVAYPTADWTWEDELTAAQQLTNTDADVWGMYAPIAYNEFYKTAAQNGCGIFGADGAVTINEPGCVEALQFMVDAVNNGVQPSPADLAGVSDSDLFLQGKLAMATTGIWMFSAFSEAEFNWDIALEPGNTEVAHHFFSNAVVVSRDTEKVDAAWAWASFFTSSPDVARLRIAANWELPALSDQTLFDEWLAIEPPASRQVVFDALDTLITPPATTQQAQVQDIIDAQIERVLAGDATAQEALDTAKTEIEGLAE